MTPLIKEVVGLVDALPEFTWFDTGTLPPITPYRSWSALNTTPMPFDAVAIAGLSAAGTKLLFLVVSKEHAMAISAYALLSESYELVPTFQAVRLESGTHIVDADKMDKARKDEIAIVLSSLDYFLTQSNPTGYRGTPKANSFINRKRAAKKKPPLQYDWVTIEIKPPAPKTDPKGGTHASPRHHERRGHWRTYPSGKRGWVNACKVGDASLGTVFHDYKIKPESMPMKTSE